MDVLNDLLNWAWARHQNPLSWYVRPLFILPFCYFAYKKSVPGIILTLVAVTSSMFWFPVPATPDPRAVALLDVERRYVGGPLTLERIILTTLIPIWFVALAWGVRRRSWLGVATVIGFGTLLKVAWLFREAGSDAWIIIPPVALGTAVCACVLLIAYTSVRKPTRVTVRASPAPAAGIAEASPRRRQPNLRLKDVVEAIGSFDKTQWPTN